MLKVKIYHKEKGRASEKARPQLSATLTEHLATTAFFDARHDEDIIPYISPMNRIDTTYLTLITSFGSVFFAAFPAAQLCIIRQCFRHKSIAFHNPGLVYSCGGIFIVAYTLQFTSSSKAGRIRA